MFNHVMSNADRHRLIAQAVQDSGSATVPELAELTSASEMTIRRDLDILAADGDPERFRGGARTLLLHGRQVTVMPLSLQAIHMLSDAPAPTTLMVPGGRPRSGEGALTGPLTLASLAALRFDTAVLGCCGLSVAEGLTAYDLDDAAVKKAIIASTRRIIAAADGSKLGRTAHAYVGPSTLVHTLVTDTTAPADEVAAIEGTGTVVKTA